jgi:hypothetical protein
MKNLTKLVNDAKKTIGFGLAGAVFLGSMGCATMTPAQRTALWGESLSVFGSLNLPGSNTKEGRVVSDIMTISGRAITNQANMKHDLEVANAGRDQIVINNNQPEYSNQNQNYSQNQNYNSPNNLESKDNSTPKGFFMYKKWADFNNDRTTNRDELIGLNEGVYNLQNLNGLWFSFYGGGDSSYEGKDLNLKIYDMEEGKTINYFNEKYAGGLRIQNFNCESKYFLKSGKYKAVLNTSNGKSFSLDFDIIK